MFSNQATIMYIGRICFVSEILKYSSADKCNADSWVFSYCQNNFCKSNFSLHLMQIAEL